MKYIGVSNFSMQNVENEEVNLKDFNEETARQKYKLLKSTLTLIDCQAK